MNYIFYFFNIKKVFLNIYYKNNLNYYIMPIHKSEDYKLSAVEYYLTEDKTQEEVCKIFKGVIIQKMCSYTLFFIICDVKNMSSISSQELCSKIYQHSISKSFKCQYSEAPPGNGLRIMTGIFFSSSSFNAIK